MRRLVPEECAVLVIDVQEKLAAAMPPAQMAELDARRHRADRGRAAVSAPACSRPSSTRRASAPPSRPIAERLARAGVAPIEKIDVLRLRRPRLRARLRRQPARARPSSSGMEAHVCVFQTVRELAARGVAVLVPIDGVASRRDDHRAAGLELCRAAGATVTTMETVVFDWLRRAGTDELQAALEADPLTR